jgi:hypothetical protein
MSSVLLCSDEGGPVISVTQDAEDFQRGITKTVTYEAWCEFCGWVESFTIGDMLTTGTLKTPHDAYSAARKALAEHRDKEDGRR